MRSKPILILCVVMLAALSACKREGPAGKGKSAPPPVPVLAGAAVRKSMPVELRTFGTVMPFSTVVVRPQIAGVLTNVLFEEGRDVRAGDLLFVVDPRPSEAAVRLAEAALARDTALLRNAEREAARQEELMKKNYTSEEVRDQARATADSLRATLAADQASLDNARLQLEYCYIRAPVDGRTGSLLVHRGNVVKANETALVTLQQLKPIQVQLALPQSYLDRVLDQMAAEPPRALATARGNGGGNETGVVFFVDNAVDPATGTIALKARFDNAGGRLWPGQFVDVTLVLSTQANAIVVPTSAVLTGQQGSYVYVIQADGTVVNRPVQADRTVENETVIASGLAAGEQVVTDGQLRLAPGLRVSVKTAGESGSGKPPRP